MRFFSGLALLLIIIGALNWGLWGFFQFDVIAKFCGGNTGWLSRVVYAVIGLAGLWSLKFLGKIGCICGSGKGNCGCGCKCCCADKSKGPKM